MSHPAARINGRPSPFLPHNLVMSIKLLAIELYRAQQEVAGLEAQCAVLALTGKVNLLDELRQARAELQLLRKMLDDKKETSIVPVRRNFID